MLQPYEIVPIESADNVRAARGLLQRFAHDTLPALVIRDLDPTDVHATVKQLAADLPEGMDSDPNTRPFEFGDAGELGPLGMHYDHRPPIEGQDELPITYHLTHSGLAIASLLGVGKNFVARTADTTATELGNELEAHFDKGLVDTDLSDTVCYQTTLEPGSLLIFKNGLPLWHRMRDVVGTGRRSTAFDSWITIRPGMGVKFHQGELPPTPTVW